MYAVLFVLVDWLLEFEHNHIGARIIIFFQIYLKSNTEMLFGLLFKMKKDARKISAQKNKILARNVRSSKRHSSVTRENRAIIYA